jgi:hypothetical protein
MQTQEKRTRIETGDTGWISIKIHDYPTQIKRASNCNERAHLEMPAFAPPLTPRLFEYAQKARTPFPERFPRLTFLATAIVLLASALAIELDYLHGAGYYWP